MFKINKIVELIKINALALCDARERLREWRETGAVATDRGSGSRGQNHVWDVK
jgi:hypothetical protein